VSAALEQDGEIYYALVCLKTGAVLGVLDDSALSDRMRTLATAAPELFGAASKTDLSPLFARIGSEHCDDAFHEVILVSATSAHIVQRLRKLPDVALMAISTDAGQLGLMLSGMRARVLQLEASP
jgi:hypothetical protein